MIEQPRPKTVKKSARARRACWSLLLAFAATGLDAAPPTMGVWMKSVTPVSANAAQMASYESFTQQEMSPIVTFTPGTRRADDWSSLVNGINYATGLWPATHRPRLVLSIPMLPRGGSPTATIAVGATGAYDTYWRQVADNLIAAGCGNNTVRIGWEFNGNWMYWSATGNPTAWTNYWKRIVRAMRTLPDGVTPKPGANFKFNWCGGGSDTGFNPALAYPEADAYGDYVDEIGADFYDSSYVRYDAEYYSWLEDPAPTANTLKKIYDRRQACFTGKTQYGSYPLNWWATFAASKGKPLTIPEWGLAKGPLSEHAGGDNPVFIQRFHEWIMNPANNVKWHAYFQEDVSFEHTKFFNVTPNPFPEATAKFLDLFTGRPIEPIFQNPNNVINSVGGYGTRSATVVQTDAGHAPFEGADHYRLTYTTNAGIQLGFPQKNITGATHLSLAVKGPLTNASQNLKVRLYAADGSYGPLVTLPRTTAYDVVDIPLSTLGSGVNLAQAKSLYFYATTAPVGTSDTVYLDSVQFIQMTP